MVYYDQDLTGATNVLKDTPQPKPNDLAGFEPGWGATCVYMNQQTAAWVDACGRLSAAI